MCKNCATKTIENGNNGTRCLASSAGTCKPGKKQENDD